MFFINKVNLRILLPQRESLLAKQNQRYFTNRKLKVLQYLKFLLVTMRWDSVIRNML